jgi:hypothetical protein
LFGKWFSHATKIQKAQHLVGLDTLIEW